MRFFTFLVATCVFVIYVNASSAEKRQTFRNTDYCGNTSNQILNIIEDAKQEKNLNMNRIQYYERLLKTLLKITNKICCYSFEEVSFSKNPEKTEAVQTKTIEYTDILSSIDPLFNKEAYLSRTIKLLDCIGESGPK